MKLRIFALLPLAALALDRHHLRTPITQSEEFYRALKLLKNDSLLVRMPEEIHGWRRPSQVVGRASGLSKLRPTTLA